MTKSTDAHSAQGKICMITGANSGIGQAVAAEFARMGATVVMVCRDRAKGEAARAGIKTATGSQSIDLMIADLSAQAAVRQLARDFKDKYPLLDVLVNNAAIFKFSREGTADGLESMFATNHLAPFLLTNLLLDSLRASGSTRVLNITAPSTVTLNFDDLQSVQRFSAGHAFGATKMANLLFTFEAARRFEGTGVMINAIHPGLAKSNLMRESNAIVRIIVNIASKPPEKSAQSIARVAFAAKFADKTGHFYHNGQDKQAPAYAYDRDIQRKLWEVSAQLTGLSIP